MPIWLIALAAFVGQCSLSQASPCLIGGTAVHRLIDGVLWLSAGGIVQALERSGRWLAFIYASASALLLLCYLASIRGWPDTLSRALMGLLSTIVYAFCPYFGPALAIGVLSRGGPCEANAAGRGVCSLFGGAIDNADDVVRLAEPSLFLGAVLISSAMLLFYLLVVIAIGLIERRRSRASGPAG